MYSGDVPDYIKNISSPRRKRHFDSLLKRASKVILQLMSSKYSAMEGCVHDLQRLGGGLCRAEHLLWTRICAGLVFKKIEALFNFMKFSSLSRNGTQYLDGPC